LNPIRIRSPTILGKSDNAAQDEIPHKYFAAGAVRFARKLVERGSSSACSTGPGFPGSARSYASYPPYMISRSQFRPKNGAKEAKYARANSLKPSFYLYISSDGDARAGRFGYLKNRCLRGWVRADFLASYAQPPGSTRLFRLSIFLIGLSGRSS
jgi:hypothetical protein